ncbi:hypothetical protein I4U23_011692 [Adineta vaga]|nr:hypothetical protein I4U23_011692 [Adineta vaga]
MEVLQSLKISNRHAFIAGYNESTPNINILYLITLNTNKEYCRNEFTKPFQEFEDLQQNSNYPESPEIDVLDDLILLSYLSNRLWNSFSIFILF